MSSTISPYTAAATVWLAFGGVASAGQLNMEVTGLNSDQGQVICRIFETAETFPRGAVFKSVLGTIKGGVAVCAFGDVSNGDYALAAAHDANANNKMDTNFLGLPREGYGFSRDAKPSFGPPSYEDAVFTVDVQGVSLSLTIQYP